MNQTVRQLTRAIASGDTEAFAYLYEQRFDSMVRDVRRYTGQDDAFCLDVVQDAMMKVIRSIKPMDTEAALTAWLRCVIKSCAYDRLRRDTHRRKRELARAGHHDSSAPCPAEQHIEHLAWLQKELQQLDADSRHLIHLRHRLGWTLQRIGNTLGLSTGAVDGRLTRAMRRLKAKAEQLDE